MTRNVPRDTLTPPGNYTKGLLRIAIEVNRCVIAQVEHDRRGVAECFVDGAVQSHEDEENARRLVACWNACQGIATETLETIGPRAVTGLTDLLRASIARKPMRAATAHAVKTALTAWGRT